MDYKDEIQRTNEYNQNDIILGLRKNFKQGSIIYVEGELNQKKYSGNGEERDLSGKIGFNYYLSTNLSCWGEAIYYKLKDREEDTRRDKIEGAFGLSARLPWDMQVYGDIRYDKILNPQRDELKSQGFQANVAGVEFLSQASVRPFVNPSSKFSVVPNPYLEKNLSAHVRLPVTNSIPSGFGVC